MPHKLARFPREIGNARMRPNVVAIRINFLSRKKSEKGLGLRGHEAVYEKLGLVAGDTVGDDGGGGVEFMFISRVLSTAATVFVTAFT